MMRDWLTEGVDPNDDDWVGEETQMGLDEWAEWENTEALWLQHDKKCRCGGPITLEDAYHFGVCIGCHVKIAAQF